MERITTNLTVSDAPRVRDLPDTHEYDFVLTLGYFDQMGYSLPDVSDTGDEYVFPDGAHEYMRFERAVNAARDALADGQNVLVHCQAGCSRSPSVCIAIIAVEDGLTYEEAYWKVKSIWEKTNPTDELEESVRRYIHNTF